MNCPVRTDEDYLEHPEWNQNPPFLAPELTTRKDLNGTVNSREHDLNDPGDEFLLETRSANQEHGEKTSFDGLVTHRASNWQYSYSSRKQMEFGGADQIHHAHSRSHRESGKTNAQTMITWAASLVVCSGLSFFAGGHWSPTVQSSALTRPETYVRHKRASTCPGSDASENEYNTPLQVGAVFIILVVSGLACSFPTLAKHFPGVRLSPRFFFSVRHFGTGVLIATAFVHLLPTAFISLGDQCLSSFWTEDYPAMPGAISLAGIFLVVVIEMIFHPCRKSPPLTMQDTSLQFGQAERAADEGPAATGEAVSLPMMRPIGGRLSSISRSLSAYKAITPSTGEATQTGANRDKSKTHDVETPITATPATSLAEEQKLRKDRLQCVLLEVGILFHSVFIGMALSVSTGSDFVVLLIAISFHQTFEGLALGSRIASIAWPRKTVQPWLMALAYGCTTPVGQAIGLGLRFQYSPDSEAGLLLVGIMNAISAGLLIFASLVELLSEDFLSDESWNVLRGGKRIVACFLVFLGAFLMSLIGAWA